MKQELGAGDSALARGLDAAIAACFAVLVVTGVALMTAYAPSPQSAWASVLFIQFIEPLGWVVRGLHHWAAHGLLALAAARVPYGAWVRSYRAPRELAWWLTLAFAVLTCIEGLTGDLLPWDQRGWWARAIEGSFVQRVPLVGIPLYRLMTGGPALGVLGLTRAYALHVVALPAALAIAIVARPHVQPRERPRADPALPRAAQGVAVAMGCLALLYGLTCWTHGASLDAPADPSSDYPARPEWFLLPVYELRRCVEGRGELWGMALIVMAAGAWFALLPWLDRVMLLRPALAGTSALVFAAAAGLGFAAKVRDIRDPAYARARRDADARAIRAAQLGASGVPAGGPLEMVRADPELRGRDLFARHCASCHVLGELGDPALARAATLDGWGTVRWIEAMLHDPDADAFFGRGPYKHRMPSADVGRKERGLGGSPLVRSREERRAIALFLSSQGDEPGDGRGTAAEGERALGESMVNTRCARCHLYRGGGDDDGTGFAPELAGYGSVAWTIAQVRDPATPKTYREKALDPGLAEHMPRFDGDLSEDDIEVVARWTRAHGRHLDDSDAP
jgi:ubiquinol-cytochrome c reductase cytochrome b subunit